MNKLPSALATLAIAILFLLVACGDGEREAELSQPEVDEIMRAEPPESSTPPQVEPGLYLPLESFLEGNTTHLRFQRAGGYVTINYYGTVAFVETDDSSAITTLVRPELVSAFRLDLYMADAREFSPGDVIEVSLEGQFPGSPARFGAVVEDVDIFYGKPTLHTQREYLEEVLFSGFGEKRHILYTVAVHRRT